MKEISKEYAYALFALGCEHGEEQQLMDELEQIASLFEQSPDYMELVCSPAIVLGERLAALKSAFDGRFCEHTVSFVCLLCEKGRMRSFAACVKEYRRLLDTKNAVSVAQVRSAVALTDRQKNALIKKLERVSGARVTLECTVDPSLLGGAVVEMDGRVIDGSVRRRLLEVKEVMNT
ncbi:MAG: ATP synthase F1 subunit delta [Clostridia bacterium]|nr:ATP synthase F1 subunit delta [Clostridia bacterium]